MNGKLNINEWAVEDRPREKLLRLGAEALTNAELLAILIGSGSTTESAVDLMKHVLGDCGNNLNQLGKLTVRQLTAYHGVGEAKAVTILAACELGKRRQKERALERTQLNSAVAIYDFMLPQMQDLDVEEAWVLFMNQNFKLLRCMRLSRGGITETSVDVRVVMKEALLSGATVLALCHNHPSGNVKPSTDDDRITRRVQQACELMRIHFLDHLVITDGLYYSYQESGRL
ncbi:MAG: DNA repair protein RadC [Prevotella sp.]|nr:DNA repair protein RadC [Prevotella sp.]MDD7046976.1 DNA repair protein RadC [Prevotella sp.]MDY5545754.1 DNA repair protein RadC [Prevotella sp.]